MVAASIGSKPRGRASWDGLPMALSLSASREAKVLTNFQKVPILSGDECEYDSRTSHSTATPGGCNAAIERFPWAERPPMSCACCSRTGQGW